jgi:hypothetical protein
MDKENFSTNKVLYCLKKIEHDIVVFEEWPENAKDSPLTERDLYHLKILLRDLIKGILTED